MFFVLSSHRAWHFAFYNNGRKWPNSDVNQCQCPSWSQAGANSNSKSFPNADPVYCDLYCPANPNENTPTVAFMEDWLLRTCEMSDMYTPDVLYFDWWIGVSPLWQPYLQKLAAFYYNRLLVNGKVGVITTKDKTMPIGADVLDFERGQACAIQKYYWQTDTSISVRSWGYINNDAYKTAPEIINSLIDIVSKNGGMLLNVGPPPNGTIPEAARKTFLEIGAWLSVVGEAIYGSRPYHLFGEGPTQVPCGSFSDTSQKFTMADFRFTVSPGKSILNVVCLGANAGNSITVSSLGAGRLGQGIISEVTVVGATSKTNWLVDSKGLHVEIPSQLPIQNGLPPVIAVSGLTDIQWDGVVRQGQDSSFHLYASVVDNFLGGVKLDVTGQYVSAVSWDSLSGGVHWTVKVRTGGNYQVTVLSASPSHSRVGVLTTQGKKVEVTVPQTASGTDFKVSTSYPVTLMAGATVEFQFQLTSQDPKGFVLAEIQLLPA